MRLAPLRGLRASLLLLALALEGAGCSNARLTLDPGDRSFDRVFPVVLDDQGHPSLVLAPFRLEHGAPAPADRAAWAEIPLDRAHQTLALVGLDGAALAEAASTFLATMTASVALELSAPPSAPSYRNVGSTTLLSTHLPASAAFLSLRRGSSTLEEADPAVITQLAAELTLVLPVEPERCGQRGSRMARFGATPHLLSGADLADGGSLVRVERIDAERIVAIGDRAVWLFRRGQPFVRDEARADHPGNVVPLRLFLADPSVDMPQLRALAVDRTSTGSALRVMVAGGSHTDRTRVGWIAELRLDAGGLTPIGTTTVSHVLGLSDFLIDPRGIEIAVGHQAMLMTRRPGGAYVLDRLEEAMSLGGYDDLDRIGLTGSDAQPHVISTKFRIFHGDAAIPSLAFEQPSLAETVNVVFDSVTAIPTGGDLEIWAAGDHLALRRLPRESWTSPVLHFPPRFTPCIDGRFDGPSSYRQVLLDADAAYLLAACSAVVRVRRSDLCVSVITLEDDPIGIAGAQLRAGDLRDGVLTVSGDQGWLLELQ